MKLSQYLENEEEKIISAVEAAEDCEHAAAVLSPILDSVLYRYIEETASDTDRLSAACMMQIVSAALPLLTCSGKTSVWLKNTGERHNEAVKNRIFPSAAGWILLVSGILCLAGSLVFSVLGGRKLFGLLSFFVAVILAACAGAALFFAGKRSNIQKASVRLPGESELKVEIRPDARRTYMILRAAALTIDKNIDRIHIQSSTKASQTETAGDLSGDMIDFCCELLEAAYTGDGSFALDKCQQTEYFLHKYGIDVIKDYEQYKDLFSRMPGKESRLIAPAVVSDGILVKKGVCTQEL